MNKIYKYFYKSRSLKIILIGIIAPLLINIVFHILFYVADLDNLSNHDGYSTTFTDFILIVVIAPFMETLFCQYAPLKFAELFIKKQKYIHFCITIIIFSIVFGLLHWKSVLYMLVAFFYGLIWSFCCFLFIRKRQHPLLYTTLIHSCYNGLLFSLTFVIEFLS